MVSQDKRIKIKKGRNPRKGWAHTEETKEKMKKAWIIRKLNKEDK